MGIAISQLPGIFINTQATSSTHGSASKGEICCLCMLLSVQTGPRTNPLNHHKRITGLQKLTDPSSETR
jgi:hypothetical protein